MATPESEAIPYEAQDLRGERLLLLAPHPDDEVIGCGGLLALHLREGRSVRGGNETRPPATFTPRVRGGMRTMVEEVVARLGDPSMLPIDARSPERFEGQPDPLDTVYGHIPGARNRYYRDNVAADGTMRPAGELKAEFERVLGNRSANEVVMYCGSGITACHNLLAMEHAGLHGAKLYPGSWSEWSADPALPMELGEKVKS